MPKKLGAARDTQARGLSKKLRKASPGKPHFSYRAQRTLGRWTAAPIFAWIIVQKRGQGRVMALRYQNGKGMKVKWLVIQWVIYPGKFIEIAYSNMVKGWQELVFESRLEPPLWGKFVFQRF